MQILLAGASGALGRHLVPRLVARGHDVCGLTRSETGAELVRSLGATPLVADALDGDAVGRAVARARPDVIVHQLTALPAELDPRHFDRDFAATNRLRTEATDHLLSAGRATGVRRVVAQSYAGWPYARVGGPVKDEDAPLDPRPAAAMRETLAAIRHLEAAVLEAPGVEGIVLRYGGFYGPHTSMAADGAMTELIRRRRVPVVGDGGGVWSFVHVDDAAEATAIAVGWAAPGVYNIVDDEPAPVAEWLPGAARALGAPPPRHVPRWLGRMLAGEVATVMMTEARGASNEKARRELGWVPRRATWREGFAELAG